MKNIMKNWILPIIGIILIYAIGICGLYLICQLTSRAHAATETIVSVGSGVYVFDIRDANAGNDISGWAPMLKNFLDEHPELEVVAIAPAHISGGRGTVNSMLVYTRNK